LSSFAPEFPQDIYRLWLQWWAKGPSMDPDYANRVKFWEEDWDGARFEWSKEMSRRKELFRREARRARYREREAAHMERDRARRQARWGERMLAGLGFVDPSKWLWQPELPGLEEAERQGPPWFYRLRGRQEGLPGFGLAKLRRSATRRRRGSPTRRLPRSRA